MLFQTAARRLASLLFLGGVAFSLSAQTPAPSTQVFSEGFESGKLDSNIWERRITGTSTITVEEGVEGAHGKYALHIHYPQDAGSNSYAFVVDTRLAPAFRTHFFGRAYVKIMPGLGPGHNPLIFAGEPGYPLSKFTEMGTYKNTWQPSYQENKSPPRQGRGEVTFHAEVGPPAGKWFLLEWEFNDDPSSITYWVDGEQVMTLVGGEKKDNVTFTWPKGSTTTSGLVGGYQELGLGARVWGATPQGFDVYYDDFAIGTARLGPVK